MEFPSPTGVKYYELNHSACEEVKVMFPSPTGVKYYEFKKVNNSVKTIDETKGFRPQQGLSIMN